MPRDWGFSDEDLAHVIERYRRPRPHSELAVILRNFAQGAIDVSDGLAGDVGKARERLPCRRRDRGAERVPLSRPAEKAVRQEPRLLATAQRGRRLRDRGGGAGSKRAGLRGRGERKGRTRDADRAPGEPRSRAPHAWSRPPCAQARQRRICPFWVRAARPHAENAAEAVAQAATLAFSAGLTPRGGS